MPLPAHSKTWQFSVNNARPTSGTVLTDSQGLLMALKNGLKGFAQNPWTVRYSCNSTTAGVAGDGVDWWSVNNSLVWQTADTGTARSWIVLRNVDGCEVLLETRNASTAAGGRGIRVVFSANAGFSGGTTSTRPTATDEVVLVLGANTATNSGTYGAGLVSNTTTTYDYVLHMLHSSDGQVTVFVICSGGLPSAFAYFGRVEYPLTGWTHPYVGMWYAENANPPSNGMTYESLFAGAYGETASPRAGARFPAGSYPVFLSSEACNNGSRSALTNTRPYGSSVSTVNQVSNEWETSGVGVVCLTAGARGKYGRLHDIRWVPSGLTTGDVAPADGSRQWAVFGSLILPWNGTVPIAA